ncbi:MAG TPA: SulP family inorganic anion transporter [Lacipirellulaceae bacterium]|nr:SulP family inorganic anion transporter [Lacipirellulaceae bacterium]
MKAAPPAENGSRPPGRFPWGPDLLASVVVFFVALPLCMGIALASGAPVAAGLITGIVGGIVTGALAGCPLQVSGPAAGLTVIVYDIVQRMGMPMLGLVVLVAGALQIAAGAFRIGQWFRAVSPAVIKGMLAGIGVLIFASQFHVMVDDKPRSSGLANLISIPEAVWKGVGIPHMAPLPERQYRTAALKQLADIARLQTLLRTEVTRLVPFHDDLDETDALDEVLVHELQGLLPRQREITRRLNELDDELDRVREIVVQSPLLERSHDALEAAEVRSAAAEVFLENGRAADAFEAQEASLAAIMHSKAQMKNHRVAALLGILTIIVIIAWTKLAPGKLRLVPGPLVAVGLATTIAVLGTLPVFYVEVPQNLASEIRFPTMTLIAAAPWSAVLQAGVLIALVASAETLLCAAAVDQLTTGSRTNYDRELISQGVGNSLCGMLGALPMTGVIVRSSANIQAGAKTRLSAILHGIWLLLFVIALAWLLAMIPTASLAAVLVYTGYKLIDLASIRRLRSFGLGEMGVYLATMITIVVTDLLTGVIVGIVLAAVKLLYTFSQLKIRVDHDAASNRYVMRLAGAATFVRLPQLAAALEQIPANTELHVELDHLRYIDHACLDLLTNWARQHEATGGQLVVDWDTLHASFRRSEPSIGEPPPRGAGAS